MNYLLKKYISHYAFIIHEISKKGGEIKPLSSRLTNNNSIVKDRITVSTNISCNFRFYTLRINYVLGSRIFLWLIQLGYH